MHMGSGSGKGAQLEVVKESLFELVVEVFHLIERSVTNAYHDNADGVVACLDDSFDGVRHACAC